MIKGYLKGLFILGLTLLPISFSSALNTLNGVSVGEVLGSNNLCLINSNLSFNCSVSDNILVAQNGGYSSSFWWRNDGLGFYNYNSYTPSQSFQGVITGFKFCEYDFIGHNSLLINNSRYRPSSCLSITYTYEQFREYINSHQLRAWGYMSESNAIGGPVFVFDDGAFRASFDIGSYYRNLYYGTYYITDFSLTGPGLSASYNNVGMITTPPYAFSENPVPDYEIGDGDTITNTDALIGFESMGLSQEYCYGGFELDNIFLPNEQFEDFSGYSFGNGASIFDLYRVYSGNNTLRIFAGQYKQSFVNGQLSAFYNKSKALLMFYQQIDSANSRGWGSFQVGDTLDYCSLLEKMVECNWQCDGDTYTGGNRNAINNGKINKDNNSGGFDTTGALNLGNYTGFSTPDEFFGRLNALFQNNIQAGQDNIVGVLPGYIILFMLALILFRMISH